MPAPTPVTTNGMTSVNTISSATFADWPTPSGYVNGDVAIVQVWINRTSTVTPPANWATVASLALSTDHKLWVFMRKLTGAQPSHHRFSLSNKAIVAGQLYRGAAATHDVANIATFSSATPAAPSVDTTGPDRLIVVGIGIHDIIRSTHPNSTREAYDLDNLEGVTDITVSSADFAQTTQGTMPAKSWSLPSSELGVVVTVALKPEIITATLIEYVGMVTI